MSSNGDPFKALVSTARCLVSRDKHRLRDERLGVDLDLTYITERIIAMGIPGEKFDSLYRNHINDVSKFLNYKHTTHYMIYNLSEKKYDYFKFNHQVKDYGWPDHHGPPLELLYNLVTDMYDWLQKHEDNVVVVHCKAGRGRTGTAIASLLIKLGICSTVWDALLFFAQKRSRTGEGVAVPSQARAINYYRHILRKGFPTKRAFRITRIELRPPPNLDYKYPVRFELSHPLHPTKPFFINQNTNRIPFGNPCVVIDCDQVVEGDVMMRLCQDTPTTIQTSVLCRCQFHTSYIRKEVLALNYNELDGTASGPLNDSRFPPNFNLLIYLEEVNKPALAPRPSLTESTSSNTKTITTSINNMNGRPKSATLTIQDSSRGRVGSSRSSPTELSAITINNNNNNNNNTRNSGNLDNLNNLNNLNTLFNNELNISKNEKLQSNNNFSHSDYLLHGSNSSNSGVHHHHHRNGSNSSSNNNNNLEVTTILLPDAFPQPTLSATTTNSLPPMLDRTTKYDGSPTIDRNTKPSLSHTQPISHTPTTSLSSTQPLTNASSFSSSAFSAMSTKQPAIPVRPIAANPAFTPLQPFSPVTPNYSLPTSANSNNGIHVNSAPFVSNSFNSQPFVGIPSTVTPTPLPIQSSSPSVSMPSSATQHFIPNFTGIPSQSSMTLPATNSNVPRTWNQNFVSPNPPRAQPANGGTVLDARFSQLLAPK